MFWWAVICVPVLGISYHMGQQAIRKSVLEPELMQTVGS